MIEHLPCFNIKKANIFLVFFCVILFLSCKNSKDRIVVSVNYENERAVSITFESIKKADEFKVFVDGSKETPVLGNLTSNDDEYTFVPIVPFSAEQHYELRHNEESIADFVVKKRIVGEAPELLAIYPSIDTVPENLLKMYFVFSQPMQEVESALNYITVTNITTAKEESIFLELEPELWNKEHTQLTLWLDPGRIKTDLIPNKEKGLPIVNENTYELKINGNWKNSNGNRLGKGYTKMLYVAERDNKKPILDNWETSSPKNNTKTPLRIHFAEPLDAILAKEVIYIINTDNKVVEGTYKLVNNETIIEFYPKTNWQEGTYLIEVESKLEDLAGNNLNHLFDVDLEEEPNQNDIYQSKTLSFMVH